MSTGSVDLESALAHCSSPPVTVEQKVPMKLGIIYKIKTGNLEGKFIKPSSGTF